MPSSFSYLASDISEFLLFYGIKFQFSILYKNKKKNKFAKICINIINTFPPVEMLKNF